MVTPIHLLRQLKVTKAGLLCGRCITLSQSTRQMAVDPEQAGRTTATLLNRETNLGILINGYSTVGFALNNGFNILGPLAIFPQSILSWNVGNVEGINEASLSLFLMIHPKIDILLIGTGNSGQQIDRSLYSFVRSKGIGLEVLPTPHACSTFNFLNTEGRRVAAGILPLQKDERAPDDLYVERVRQMKWEKIEAD